VILSPSRAADRETWAELREQVGHLLDDRGEVWRPIYNDRAGDGAVRFEIGGSARLAFLVAVGRMLEVLGPKLHRCDPEGGCHNIVAAIGHWRYCSPEHAASARMRRWLEAKKPKTASAHPTSRTRMYSVSPGTREARCEAARLLRSIASSLHPYLSTRCGEGVGLATAVPNAARRASERSPATCDI